MDTWNSKGHEAIPVVDRSNAVVGYIARSKTREAALGNRKNVVIAGVGETGEYLAATFVARGHDVLVVDTSAERLAEVSSRLDIQTLAGHACRHEVLEQVRADRADLFVSVTGSDTVNLVSALKARAMGARKTAAVIEEVDHFEEPAGIYHDWLGVDLVLNTRFLVANEIHKLIRTQGAVAVEDFAENRVEMVQFRVNAETPFIERPLNQVRLPWECLVVAIQRGRGLIIPRGEDSIHVGDEVLVIGRTDEMVRIAEALGRRERPGRKTILLGGGTVGLVLAQALQGLVPDITLIERDRARCEFLSRELQSVSVVHGDGTSAALLQEEGIETCEVFAAVSGEEERNIIAARLAKELGASRCIALVSRPYFVEVCRHLGLEVVPGPAQIIAREVVRAIMPTGILGSTPVMGNRAEFVEAVVPPNAPLCGRPLREAGFPKGSVVCVLMDSQRMLIPRGDTVIPPDARIVVFVLKELHNQVVRLLGGFPHGGGGHP